LAEPLLEVRNLKVHFPTEDGLVRAVDGISFSVAPGETLGVVGESGSGKSVTAMSILGLLPTPPADIYQGAIMWRGENLLDASPERMQEVRGGEIAMIFQDPLTALNPVHRVGNQIASSWR